jgi:hypothetical protein
MNKKILKEYIKEILSEDEGESSSSSSGGGGYDYGYGGGGGGGGSGGSHKSKLSAKASLRNVVGRFKKIGSRLLTIAKLSKEMIVTTIFKPWEKPDYKKIVKDGNDKIEKLKKEYPDISLWDALPDDFKFIASLKAAPYAAFKMSTGAIKNTAKFLTSSYDPMQNVSSLFGPSLISEEEKKEITPETVKLMEAIIQSMEEHLKEVQAFLKKENEEKPDLEEILQQIESDPEKKGKVSPEDLEKGEKIRDAFIKTQAKQSVYIEKALNRCRAQLAAAKKGSAKGGNDASKKTGSGSSTGTKSGTKI